MENKRKHHIIPVAYLSGFTDEAGKIYQFLKDKPLEPQYNVPRELGHRRDYYAQPLPNGNTDFNKLEDFFGTIESTWPNILTKLESRTILAEEELSTLYTFLYLMKVRVPATRDGVEKMLAFQVKEMGRMLEVRGELPPRPPELEGVDIQVSIDPHQSIHAMTEIAKGFQRVLDAVHFVIYHNKTQIPLLTSDNPIVYFDSSAPENEMQPYALEPRSLEFIFPISSSIVLHGHPSYTDPNHPYKTIANEKKILRFNRLICKFGYERIFASTRKHEPLIVRYAEKSPILDIDTHSFGKGRFIQWRHKFGVRTKLPKWDHS